MFRFREKASKEVPLTEKLKEMNPVLQVDGNPDLAMQLKLTNMTKEDLAVAQCLKPYIEENIQEIMEKFYDNIEQNPDLRAIINKHSSTDKLKKTLRRHITEMFSGVLNTEFMEKRKKIAIVHLHIGLTQKWYIASFSSLFESFADVIYKNLTLPEDQALALRVCNRLLSLEQQVVLEAYDDQLDIVRESEVRSKAKVETIAMLEQTSNELATHSQQTNGLIQEMTARMDIIAQNAKGGRVLAEEAQQTANDGNTQLDKINRTIERVEESSRMVGEQMKNLEMMTNQIKDIVGIVKGIADQTNLLSLNASIEAARAGEHGKGAAVVASEVRKLAEGTRDSVMNVSELVNKINEYVASSSSSLEQAQTLVEETKDQMNGTRKSFKNILQTMENTKESNVRIEQDLESFLQAIYEIEQSAATLATTAENLNVMMEELNE